MAKEIYIIHVSGQAIESPYNRPQSVSGDSDVAYEFGTRQTNGIIKVREGAFVCRYEPSTQSIFVSSEVGDRIKSFYKWNDRTEDHVILTLKRMGLID